MSAPSTKALRAELERRGTAFRKGRPGYTRDRAQVDAFWQAGVDAGYRDDGEPGPRTQYGPSYYGGFLLDPDGKLSRLK
jgi:hypothetical protein